MKHNLFLISEVGRHLNRSGSAIRLYVQQGKLRCFGVTPGGVRIFHADDVAAFAKTLNEKQ